MGHMMQNSKQCTTPAHCFYPTITQIQFAGHLIERSATRGRAEPDVMAVGEMVYYLPDRWHYQT
jgi:hypothetical protein